MKKAFLFVLSLLLILNIINCSQELKIEDINVIEKNTEFLHICLKSPPQTIYGEIKITKNDMIIYENEFSEYFNGGLGCINVPINIVHLKSGDYKMNLCVWSQNELNCLDEEINIDSEILPLSFYAVGMTMVFFVLGMIFLIWKKNKINF